MRLFIALRLSQAWHEALEELAGRLRQHDPGSCLRWVRPDRMHLTLRFLGDVDQARLPLLRAAVQRAVCSHRAPTLGTERLGAFPNLQRPRLIWVGVAEHGDRLGPLQAAIEAAVVELGWEAERRPFRAHLTLGRLRDPRRGLPPRLAEALRQETVPRLTPSPQSHLALMRSHLSQQGAHYEVLHEWQLAG